MRHRSKWSGMAGVAALALVAAGLASCGRMARDQRAAWRDQAEAQCMASRQVQTSSYVSLRSTPIEGPGTCGMAQPLRVNAFAGGNVRLSSAATLACPIVPTTDKWLEKVVQKAASERLGAQVVEIRAGSYSCRAMNNGSGTRRTSEHAYGNALDIFSFRISDGRDITVKTGWNGAPDEQAFLREIFLGACDMYGTVLGPGSDMFHYDHFHVDMARHAGGRRICKPRVNAPGPADFAPPQPDRGVWASARGGSSAPFGQTGSASAGSALAISGQPLVPERAMPPGWNSGPAGRPAPFGQSQIASTPSTAPLMLPGSAYLRDEVVVGDLEGRGILDQPGNELQGSDMNAQDLITPENDPFALGNRSLRR